MAEKEFPIAEGWMDHQVCISIVPAKIWHRFASASIRRELDAVVHEPFVGSGRLVAEDPGKGLADVDILLNCDAEN